MTLSERERELLDELIEFWQRSAKLHDGLSDKDRRMAERRRDQDLERVALLKKLKEIVQRSNH